jgi:hypothetical protein
MRLVDVDRLVSKFGIRQGGSKGAKHHQTLYTAILKTQGNWISHGAHREPNILDLKTPHED